MATTTKIDVNGATYTALTTAGQKIRISLDRTIGGGRIVIGTALPAANTENYFVVRNADLPLTFAEPTGSDIVYFKSDGANTTIRAIVF